MEIYGFGITIYDYFDPKKAGFNPFSDRNNRKSKIANPKLNYILKSSTRTPLKRLVSKVN